MAFVIRLLNANVTNAGSQTVLYSCSSPNQGAIVNNIRFVNTGGSAATVNLFFKPSGGATHRILDKDKSVAAGDIFVVKSDLTMFTADQIEATTSAAMDYVVSGMEKV